MELITRGPRPNLPGPAREYNPEPYATSPSNGQEGEGILRRLWRRKFLFLTVFVLTGAAVAAGYYALTPMYKAEGAVAVAPSDRVLASQQVTDGQQTTVGDVPDLESQSVILTSPRLLRQLLDRPDIQAALLSECELAAQVQWKVKIREFLHGPRPSCQDQLADTAQIVADLHSRLSVGVSGRSRVLSLSFVSRSPKVAELIVNGLVQAYLDLRMDDKLQPRDAAIQWLQTETARLADHLKTTERQIESFLHANGVIKGQVASLASEQLTGLAQQIGAAEAERAAAAGKMQQARVPGGATSAVLSSSAAQDVKQHLSQVTADMATATARYGSNFPAVVELQKQKADLERLLSHETQLVNRSAESDYQAATARVTALRQQLDALKREVRGNDDATTQVAALQRDADTDRELLLDLTRSLNQLQTDRRLATANARLVNWAEPPQGVFFPKVNTFALVGTFLAIALASAAALLRDRADGTVRTISGLQAASDLRVLARIPHVSGLGRSPSRLVRQIQRPSPFQEAIRGLYAECLLLNGRRDDRRWIPQSFMVTSSSSGEGKSLTVISLAQFAAAAGQRVLVLECDLRRPDIGRSLSLSAQPGVSDVLQRRVTPAQAVRPTDTPNLDVMLAGRSVNHSAELIGSKAMTELLAWASAEYDLIILDTPPSRVLADARILASSVDCVLYCAQWGHSSTDSIIDGVQSIREAGGHVLGLVLGRVRQAQYQLYNADTAGVTAYPAVHAG